MEALNIGVAGKRTNSQKLCSLRHGAILGHWSMMKRRVELEALAVSIRWHLFPLQPSPSI